MSLMSGERITIGLNYSCSGMLGQTLLRGTNLACKMSLFNSKILAFHKFWKIAGFGFFLIHISDIPSKVKALWDENESSISSVSKYVNGSKLGQVPISFLDVFKMGKLIMPKSLLYLSSSSSIIPSLFKVVMQFLIISCYSVSIVSLYGSK